eukprot:365466-Chlamydomonas_euryale.AAC.10
MAVAKPCDAMPCHGRIQILGESRRRARACACTHAYASVRHYRHMQCPLSPAPRLPSMYQMRAVDRGFSSACGAECWRGRALVGTSSCVMGRARNRPRAHSAGVSDSVRATPSTAGHWCCTVCSTECYNECNYAPPPSLPPSFYKCAIRAQNSPLMITARDFERKMCAEGCVWRRCVWRPVGRAGYTGRPAFARLVCIYACSRAPNNWPLFLQD